MSSKAGESSLVVVRSPAGRFERGGASPNPRGRPRSGTSFAERVRDRVDPAVIIDAALDVLETAEEPRDRLAAAQFLADRGWGRPLQSVQLDAALSPGPALPAAWDSMSPAARASYLDRVVAGAALQLADGSEDDQ